ncbi:MAG TPA: VCBS repeat-containing protein [Polyangiales bacterium]|nr:VCBS repeat-containing protein [Polyangiales bacterium]
MKHVVSVVAVCWVVAVGCETAPVGPQSTAADAPTSNAAGGGGVAPSAGRAGEAGHAGSATCDAAATSLRIADSPLRAAGPLHLSEEVVLAGEGLAQTEGPQQNPSAGLRWQGDRMFLLADAGFWDIPVGGPARWYATSSTLLWGVRAGDLDGDGDFDLLVLSMALNVDTVADADADAGSMPPSPLVSRLTVWERGPEGLSQRSVLRSSAGMSFPMPYELGDVDADGDLDIVTFELGVAVGYINHGEFQLTRETLSESTPANENLGALLVHLADRNGDGLPDLLVIGGDPLVDPLENRMFVLLGQGPGRFGPMGPSTTGKSPLVPHGPDGIGIGIADVTGDGLADVLMQDPAAPEAGIIRLHKSTSATELSPPIELSGLGFAFGDIDGDGTTDIVTTRSQQLQALLPRSTGELEPRDLGLDTTSLSLLGFVVDPTQPTLHVLHKQSKCQ